MPKVRYEKVKKFRGPMLPDLRAKMALHKQSFDDALPQFLEFPILNLKLEQFYGGL